MGFRLFRRKKLFPGVTLNLSKSGPSLRFGGRGAGVTVGGRRGTRATLGAPGTGMYYTTTGRHRRRTTPALHAQRAPGVAATSRSAAGVLWTIAVIIAISLLVATGGLATIPIAIALALYIWHRRTRPEFKARQILKSAQTQSGMQAVETINRAMAIDPTGSKTAAMAGDLFTAQKCWEDASRAYSVALAHQHDWEIEANYVKALLIAGHLDEAIPRLEHDRSQAWLTDESRASVSAMLAAAYLQQGDASRAYALVAEEPLQRHNLGFGLQQCLMLRAESHYLLGRRSRAIADVDRLYAINSAYPSLQETKNGMLAGTFSIDGPKPYPDWYRDPTDGASGVTLDQVPAPVPILADPNPESPWLSPDGKWRWDGSNWVAADC